MIMAWFISISEASIIILCILLFDGGYEGGLQSIVYPFWSIILGSIVTFFIIMPSEKLIVRCTNNQTKIMTIILLSFIASIMMSGLIYLLIIIFAKGSVLGSAHSFLISYTLLFFIPLTSFLFLKKKSRMRSEQLPQEMEEK
jgi:hypothetical protein